MGITTTTPDVSPFVQKLRERARGETETAPDRYLSVGGIPSSSRSTSVQRVSVRSPGSPSPSPRYSGSTSCAFLGNASTDTSTHDKDSLFPCSRSSHSPSPPLKMTDIKTGCSFLPTVDLQARSIYAQCSGYSSTTSHQPSDEAKHSTTSRVEALSIAATQPRSVLRNSGHKQEGENVAQIMKSKDQSRPESGPSSSKQPNLPADLGGSHGGQRSVTHVSQDELDELEACVWDW